MNGIVVKFIDWAKENNWFMIEKNNKSLALNSDFVKRYSNIPELYLEFLNTVKQLLSPDEKSWFLCEDEYNDNSDLAFKWNEFELVSLEAAEDDEDWKAEIISWWNNKLPIIMSVEDGYSFYAIDLINKGSVVKGYDPEFEETEEIANNLEEFFELIINNRIKL